MMGYDLLLHFSSSAVSLLILDLKDGNVVDNDVDTLSETIVLADTA
jgi:hypothetical protein